MPDANNGGSAILGYDLWRDDGSNGDFTSLFSTNTILGTTFTDINVTKALLYRYKYRARNINGYGEFSEVGYLFAASVPGKPEAPAMTAVDSSSITLQFFVPTDSGGSDITSYELHMD